MKYIEEVEEVFSISHGVCVIGPGIPYVFEPSVSSGAKIQIRNPGGSVVDTTLQSVEKSNHGLILEHVPFSVDPSVKQGDIEIGAKIYLVSD